MTFHIYIIYSAIKDKYYVGQTENLQKRLLEHILRKNLGTGDWVLKYSEEFQTRSESVLREKEIKNKKSRKYIEYLISSAG